MVREVLRSVPVALQNQRRDVDMIRPNAIASLMSPRLRFHVPLALAGSVDPAGTCCLNLSRLAASREEGGGTVKTLKVRPVIRLSELYLPSCPCLLIHRQRERACLSPFDSFSPSSPLPTTTTSYHSLPATSKVLVLQTAATHLSTVSTRSVTHRLWPLRLRRSPN